VAGVAVCASAHASVALTASSLEGYAGSHGHDLLVEACYCGSRGRLDVEWVASRLSEALEGLGLKPRGSLDSSLAPGSLVEDALEALAGILPGEAPGGFRLCRLSASWLWGLRRVELLLGGPDGG